MPTSVALLATGDELVNGDILNTNSQYISQRLLEHGLPVDMHMVVKDHQAGLESAILYLLDTHDILLTIGGLGPTSDDRTRFALSQALNLPLVFDEKSWQMIIERLTRLKLSVPESNRAQALFPEGATIIPNQYGSANACKINRKNKVIYMLPGPPHECLAIFDEIVVPDLKKFFTKMYRKHWLLFNVSEGQIAQELDHLLDDSAVELGYRINYPYLEIKLVSSDQAALESIAQKFLPFFKDHIVSEQKLTWLEQCQNALQHLPRKVWIHDEVTQGLLQSKLVTKKNFGKVFFTESLPPKLNEHEYALHIFGMQEWWQEKPADSLQLTLQFSTAKASGQKALSIPYRPHSLQYALELIAREMLQLI